MNMLAGVEKFAGPGYRLARPLNVEQISGSSAKLKLTYLSPEGYRIRSWAVNSDQRVRIKLSFGDLAEAPGGTCELIAQAEFVGQRGRVQLAVKSKRFLEDAATVRKYVLTMAKILMGGAEPYSSYRRGGSFIFYFSSDPERSLENLLNSFVLPDGRGWNESGRAFLFHPENQDGTVREIEIFDAWIVNRIAELELASQVIDPAEIARQAGVTEKRVITQIGRINEMRRNWGLSPLPRHPSFAEIDTAVKLLRRELPGRPALADVAQKLAVEPSALKTALEQYNRARAAKNLFPLHHLD